MIKWKDKWGLHTAEFKGIGKIIVSHDCDQQYKVKVFEYMCDFSFASLDDAKKHGLDKAQFLLEQGLRELGR